MTELHNVELNLIAGGVAPTVIVDEEGNVIIIDCTTPRGPDGKPLFNAW